MTLMLCLAVALGWQAPSADPLAGSWKANIEKSQRDPNHQFSEATMRFDVKPDGITLNVSGINKAGHPESSTVVFHPDGKAYPVAEAPGITAISTRTERKLESVGMKDGVELARSVYEVSADGATLTATVKGVDASGKPFAQVIVFDRVRG